METIAGNERVRVAGGDETERSWARIARIAAYAAAAGFFVMTALYLLDQLDLLDPSPEYVATSAGQLQDEARFWAQVFEHEHRIVWDVIARDVVGPAAFIGLIVVVVALRRRIVGDARPANELMVWLVAAGGIISAFASLLYLGNVEYWRQPWGPVPTGGETSIVAVGRATTAIDNLTVWSEAFGFVVVALGLLCVAATIHRAVDMPNRLATLTTVTAIVLLALAVASVCGIDEPRSALSALVGMVLAPWTCVWLGRVLGRGR